MLNIITLAFLFKKDQDTIKEAIKLTNKNKLLIVKIANILYQQVGYITKQATLKLTKKLKFHT